MAGRVVVGLHRGKGRCTLAEAWMMDGGRSRSAGRRRLDATKAPPISTRKQHDLLPAASAGGANASQPLRELVSSPPG
jgi:hypothetical protein